MSLALEPLSLCRSIASNEFYRSLNHFRGKVVTELMFRDFWLDGIRTATAIFQNGWYSPPELGCAILFATGTNYQRVDFVSLRTPESWPSNCELDWENGLVYVFCSPVDRRLGEIADFTAFHYLGNDRAVTEHIAECRSVHAKILSKLQPGMTSLQFHAECNTIVNCSNLYIEGHSNTDPAKINFGHSFTTLPVNRLTGPDLLTEEDINYLSISRRFINAIDDWRLADVRCFSVEPRLRSRSKSFLPQVSLHTIASLQGGIVRTQSDTKNIFPFE